MFRIRFSPLALVVFAVPMGLAVSTHHPIWGGLMTVLAMALCGLGLLDVMQTHSSVLRNSPISARMRFLLETFRPETRQYFVERDQDATPFSGEQRALL